MPPLYYVYKMFRAMDEESLTMNASHRSSCSIYVIGRSRPLRNDLMSNFSMETIEKYHTAKSLRSSANVINL